MKAFALRAVFALAVLVPTLARAECGLDILSCDETQASSSILTSEKFQNKMDALNDYSVEYANGSGARKPQVTGVDSDGFSVKLVASKHN